MLESAKVPHGVVSGHVATGRNVLDCRRHFSLWMQAMCPEWARVVHLGVKVEIRKDEALFGTGETMRGIYFLEKGTMRLVSTNLEGHETILLYVTEQNLLGESALYNRMPVFARFTAVEDCVLHFFDEKTVKETILPANPDLLENLLQFMAYKVGVVLHHHCEIIDTNLKGKVCRLLFDFSQHAGGRKTITPKITQQEMATALGMHRATLSRTLADLKKEGIVEKATKKQIVINDLEALRRYADDPYAL